MGLLTIDGTLDLNQFWPFGDSDADTTKLIIDVGGVAGPIRYQPFPNAPASATDVYDGAKLKPFEGAERVIKNGKITVRLQGLDAPELHVQPSSLVNVVWKDSPLGSLRGTGLIKSFRQAQAETAVVKLVSALAALGPSPLACRYVSQLNHEQGPADAIDKYGRFVGNVVIASGARVIDVNLLILERGLALVALYNSMLRDEIDACVRAWKKGVKARRGICRYATDLIFRFDPNSLYRRKGSAIVDEGDAAFIHPKLYRRQCTWWAYRQAGRFTSGFDTFLGLAKDDVFFETSDFLKSGALAAVQIPLDRMVTRGKVVYAADKVVFKEAPSELFAANGARVERW